jgi:tripartite ATP-independent transporter DctP family solute receptor
MEKCHRIQRRSVLGLGAAAALGASIGPLARPAQAQQKTVLKYTNDHPTGYPTVAAVEAMGKKLQAATNGRLSIDSYPGGVLGGPKEVIEQLQVGAVQMYAAGVGWLGSVVNEINVFNLPFVFRDTTQMQKVIDGDIGRELLDKITNHPTAKLVGLCWLDAGARSFYDSKKPIHTMADLKGLKIRVQGNPMFVDMMNALGGNGVPLGYDQVFSALQTGVIDGAENNMPSYVFDNHYQAAKFYTRTEHLIVPDVLVASRKNWDSLSADDRALITKFARDVQMDNRKFWNEYETAAMEKAKAAGVQFFDVAPADKKAFQDAVKPVWDKYGAPFADIIKRIQAVG